MNETHESFPLPEAIVLFVSKPFQVTIFATFNSLVVYFLFYYKNTLYESYVTLSMWGLLAGQVSSYFQ